MKVKDDSLEVFWREKIIEYGAKKEKYEIV